MPTIRTTPTYIPADLTQQKLVSVTSGGDVFYKATSDVDAEDTKIEVGKSATITAGQYFISASTSKIRVDDVASPTVEDLTVRDDLIVNGEAELNGELNHDGTKAGFFGTTPDVRSTKLSAKSAETIDSSYGAPEADVLTKLVTRVGEIEALLVKLGFIKEAS